jgi:hypothetical protein
MSHVLQQKFDKAKHEDEWFEAVGAPTILLC